MAAAADDGYSATLLPYARRGAIAGMAAGIDITVSAVKAAYAARRRSLILRHIERHIGRYGAPALMMLRR